MCLKSVEDGLLLYVYLTPNASQNRMGGFIERPETPEGALKIYVTVPPEENKANKALLKFLARTFKLSLSDLKIVKGLKDRLKVIHICRHPQSLLEYVAKITLKGS